VTQKRKGAAGVDTAPAVSRKPVPVGIESPTFGCNTDTGKVAEGIYTALEAAGVSAGFINHPDNRGYGKPQPAPEQISKRMTLAKPFVWKYDRALPLIGVLASTDMIAPDSWIDPLRFAEHVLAPSKWAASIAGGKAKVMPFGVDPVFALGEREPHNRFRVLFAAEDAAEQIAGLDIAYPAFRKAFRGRDDVEFVIRSTQNGLEKDDSRVILELGNRTPQQMADLYRSADVLVFSARAAAFPMMALEALACGTPVIHSGQTGMADIKHLGIVLLSRAITTAAGTVHEMFYDEIAAQLREIESNPAFYVKHAAEHAAAVDRRFRWDVTPIIDCL
jgi:glycosyltransferase involved in cell wall biosynthesis